MSERTTRLVGWLVVGRPRTRYIRDPVLEGLPLGNFNALEERSEVSGSRAEEPEVRVSGEREREMRADE